MIYGLMTPHQYFSLCSKESAHISERHRVSEVGGSVDLWPVGRSYKCSHSGIDFQANCTRCFAHSYHPMLRPIPSQYPLPASNSHLSPVLRSEDSCCQQWRGQQWSQAAVQRAALLITAHKRAACLFKHCCEMLPTRPLYSTYPWQVIMGWSKYVNGCSSLMQSLFEHDGPFKAKCSI